MSISSPFQTTRPLQSLRPSAVTRLLPTRKHPPPPHSQNVSASSRAPPWKKEDPNSMSAFLKRVQEKIAEGRGEEERVKSDASSTAVAERKSYTGREGLAEARDGFAEREQEGNEKERGESSRSPSPGWTHKDRDSIQTRFASRTSRKNGKTLKLSKPYITPPITPSFSPSAPRSRPPPRIPYDNNNHIGNSQFPSPSFAASNLFSSRPSYPQPSAPIPPPMPAPLPAIFPPDPPGFRNALSANNHHTAWLKFRDLAMSSSPTTLLTTSDITSLLQVLLANGKLELMCEALDNAEQVGILRDVRWYELVLEGCVAGEKEKGMTLARGVVERMEKEGVEATMTCQTAWVELLCGAGEFEEARKLYESIFKRTEGISD